MTKILLVEDDKSLREIYGVRLLAEGYDIISAGDGEAALAMAIKERPSLIVSDVMMPKISGFDMLDILRSTTETKDIKVIMMTALSSEDQRARGEALGADRYLVKSQVGIEDVVRTVHDVLGDAPVSTVSAAQTFGSSAPRPAPSSAPAPRSAQPLQQTMPTPPPFTAAATPQPRPQQPTMAPAPQARPNALPQPTAPFSGNRPANLGERVLHPVSQPAGGARPDISSLMEQELNQSAAPQPAPLAPPSPPPAPPVSYQPQAATAPAPMSTPLSVSPSTAPQMPTPAPIPQPEEEHGSGINFEETPRPPMPAPTNTSAPQPPSEPFGAQPPRP
jgi:CheY-like chemotaxis protein